MVMIAFRTFYFIIFLPFFMFIFCFTKERECQTHRKSNTALQGGRQNLILVKSYDFEKILRKNGCRVRKKYFKNSRRPYNSSAILKVPRKDPMFAH